MYHISSPCNLEMDLVNPVKEFIVYKGDDIIYFQFARPNEKILTANFNIVEDLCPCTIYFNTEVNNVTKNSLRKQLNYDIQLPENEHYYDYGGFKLSVSDRTNVACIIPELRRMYVCHDFYNFPYPIRVFILNHELGHMKWVTESHCDMYALKNCLERGHNYSNLLYAQSLILSASAENVARQLKIFNELKRQGAIKYES